MMYLVVIFIPPVYFLLRKKWGMFVINGILYTVGLIGLPIFGLGFAMLIPAILQALWQFRKELMHEQAEVLADAMARKMKAGSSV